MSTVKESLKQLIDQLSDESTWDDVMEQIYVRQKIEAGLEDEAAGRVKSHDDVFEKYGELK